MLSSGYYIESGFNEIDSTSNDFLTDIVQKATSGIQELSSWYYGLNNDEAMEMQDKLNAMLYMTINYYKKKVTVTQTYTTFGDVGDIKMAQQILIAQRCQSSYIDFMKKVEKLKAKYNSVPGYKNAVQMTQQEWKNIVKQYHDAQKELIKEMDVYASIKYAFLYGEGINLCTGSASFNKILMVRTLFAIN